MKTTLLVLAAGMGSRYGGLKQIDSIGPAGEAIIDYSVYDALKSGFSKIVFLIRHDIEREFRKHIGRKFEDRADVDYAFQETDSLPGRFSCPAGRTKPWGTGHAVLCAHNHIKTPFAVINGDDFYGRESFQLINRFLSETDPEKPEFAMVGYLLAKTLSKHGSVSRGICALEENDYLKSVTEYTEITQNEKTITAVKNSENFYFNGDEMTSLNLFGFTPVIFNTLQSGFEEFLKKHGREMKSEYFIPSVVDRMIRNNKASVKILRSPDPWFGVTYQEDKDYVKEEIFKLCKNGIYPTPLFS